jgi:hypothetical protein
VVVVSTIHVQLAASEEVDKPFQGILARRRLHNHEYGLHLPAKRHAAIPLDGGD